MHPSVKEAVLRVVNVSHSVLRDSFEAGLTKKMHVFYYLYLSTLACFFLDNAVWLRKLRTFQTSVCKNISGSVTVITS